MLFSKPRFSFSPETTPNTCKKLPLVWAVNILAYFSITTVYRLYNYQYAANSKYYLTIKLERTNKVHATTPKKL